MSNPPELLRVRHETRFRRLQVQRVERLTPGLVRVALGGEELQGFVSAGFDDHVKLIFPPVGGGELIVPVAGPNGPALPDGVAKPMMRDYTPRRYDGGSRELLVDFVIHDAGPATTWAAAAAPGQLLGVGGPRGSIIIPADLDCHLLVGDETALPAIARRLEELPPTTRAIVVAEVADSAEQLTFRSAAPFEVVWIHRGSAPLGSPDGLLQALRNLSLPSGEYFTWVAAESQVARAVRQYMIAERGTDKRWIKAAGYWQRGSSGAHVKIED